MKKYFRVGVVLLLVLGSVAFVFADIRETQKERGGSNLQNVHDRVLCVDGFKVFQTIVFGFVKDGGAAVSNIQLNLFSSIPQMHYGLMSTHHR